VRRHRLREWREPFPLVSTPSRHHDVDFDDPAVRHAFRTVEAAPDET
jgi:hypothetical protein